MIPHNITHSRVEKGAVVEKSSKEGRRSVGSFVFAFLTAFVVSAFALMAFLAVPRLIRNYERNRLLNDSPQAYVERNFGIKALGCLVPLDDGKFVETDAESGTRTFACAFEVANEPILRERILERAVSPNPEPTIPSFESGFADEVVETARNEELLAAYEFPPRTPERTDSVWILAKGEDGMRAYVVGEIRS